MLEAPGALFTGDTLLIGTVGLRDAPGSDGEAPDSTDDFDLRKARERVERETIVAALARADGNVLRASEMLGVSRPTLYDLMRKLGIK